MGGEAEGQGKDEDGSGRKGGGSRRYHVFLYNFDTINNFNFCSLIYYQIIVCMVCCTIYY